VIDFEEFQASMIDRRAHHVNVFRGKPYTPVKRSWAHVTGICLHQTACNMGERVERYDAIAVHFVVLRSGRVLWMADIDEVLIHGNGWNNQCVGIEIDGLYAGLESDPLRTTWDDPTTPTREQPQQVTPEAMESARQLVRWIVAEVARNGGSVHALVAHRQSSGSRENDPGEAIWKQVALPLHAELALDDGGVGFKLDDGYPIPEQWDPRCVGIKY
jgi:N-acetylmuramoyl-L-alanine amidase-like protein